MVGAKVLHHLNHEWEGGRWQAKPPTCILSVRGGGAGCEGPPSLKLQVEGWYLAGNSTNSRYEQERGWRCSKHKTEGRCGDDNPSIACCEQGSSRGWGRLPLLSHIVNEGAVGGGGGLPLLYRIVSKGEGGGVGRSGECNKHKEEG